MSEIKWTKITGIIGENWNVDEEREIIGKLINKKSEVGRYKSWVYELETETGIKNIWGCTVLDKIFKDIPIGKMVKVEYLGEEKNPKTDATYKNYDVSIGDVEEDTLEEIVSE